jgi:hypothetical protein
MSTGPLPAVGTVYAPDVHPPPFTVSKAVALPTLGACAVIVTFGIPEPL